MIELSKSMKLRLLYQNLLLWILCLGISGCRPSHPVILPGSTSFETAISDYAFSPTGWRVPGGREITIIIHNYDLAPHDFTLMARPSPLPFSASDEAHVIFRAAIPANSETTIHFRAPAAPGEYQVLSSLPGDAEKGLVGALVVVLSE